MNEKPIGKCARLRMLQTMLRTGLTSIPNYNNAYLNGIFLARLRGGSKFHVINSTTNLVPVILAHLHDLLWRTTENCV